MRGARARGNRDDTCSIQRIEPEEVAAHEVDGGRAAEQGKALPRHPGHRAGAEPPGSPVVSVEIEAVHSQRAWIIGWRELTDCTKWRRGWV